MSEPILHDWIKDENGYRKDFGDDNHSGPMCVRCHASFCEWCDREKLTEPCEEQTPYLFDEEFLKPEFEIIFDRKSRYMANVMVFSVAGRSPYNIVFTTEADVVKAAEKHPDRIYYLSPIRR